MNIIIGRGPLSQEIYSKFSKDYFYRFTNFNFYTSFTIFKKNINCIYIFADSNSIIYCIYLIFIILLFSKRNKPQKVIYIGSLSCCSNNQFPNKEIKKYSGYDYYSLKKRVVSFLFLKLFNILNCRIQVWHPGIILGRNQNWNIKLTQIANYDKVKLIYKNNISAPLTYIDSIILKIKENKFSKQKKEFILIDKVISWEDLINSFASDEKPKIKFIYEEFDNNFLIKLKIIIKLILKILIFNTPIYYIYSWRKQNNNIEQDTFEFDYRTKELMINKWNISN